MSTDARHTVAIAGASGFVGRALTSRLLEEGFEVIALSRRPREDPREGVTWRACDLFRRQEVEEALDGAECAFYLVHSMLPSARLTQADFQDLDLILADNFARAASSCGVRQIVYLGGIVPDARPLSPHLESRLEVEAALGSHGVPLTSARAGLVVGPGGSSFDMLLKLVRRLPTMLLPEWTRTRMSPIALDDIVAILAGCALNEEAFGVVGDVGAAPVTYRSMIAATAEALGLKRTLRDLPLMTPKLSSLWVSLITGAPMSLVSPLVDSLECPMVADDTRLQELAGVDPVPFEAALEAALAADRIRHASPSGHAEPGRNTVRSVQRLPLPGNFDMYHVAREYMNWLPGFMWPFIQVREPRYGTLRFQLALTGVSLLELTLSSDGTDEDRILFEVTGGALTNTSALPYGTLEFRPVMNKSHALAAIHDFVPRLPWFLYRASQAPIHLLVMYAFGLHLGSIPDAEAGDEGTLQAPRGRKGAGSSAA